MMVFWAILKGIGWLALILLCLLLGCVMLALFVPLRYRAEGAYQERFSGKAKVTWLLHLVTAEVSFSDQVSYCVRVLGIRLVPKREKKISQKTAKKEVEKAAKEAVAAVGETVGEDSGNEDAKTQGQARQESVQAFGNGKGAGKTPPPQGTEKSLTKADRREGGQNATQDFGEDLTEKIWEKILLFLEKMSSQYGQLRDKIRKVCDTLSYYMKILRREETGQLCRLFFSQLKNILHGVLPRKLLVRLCIGTKNPASTGQIMALYGMLYPMLGNRVVILPDFEEAHAEGSFYLKGRITVCRLVICMLRIGLNKNFRMLIRILRKKEEA